MDIYTNLHESTSIYINRHKSRFKALQALFLADIAHYNNKSCCGLSKGLKMLASMFLSTLSKVVLEVWGKCVLGYTLLPNCCAENGLHPCIIFQVGKPNTPQSSFSGVATIPKQAWQIDFCAHKSTTCYSQELSNLTNFNAPQKRCSTPTPFQGIYLFLSLLVPSSLAPHQSAWHGCEGTPEHPPKHKNKKPPWGFGGE